MKKKPWSAQRSAQTEPSVGDTPFRRGSVREEMFRYLRKPRTFKEFVALARRRGVDAPNLMRFFRKGGVDKGKTWVLMECWDLPEQIQIMEVE